MNARIGHRERCRAGGASERSDAGRRGSGGVALSSGGTFEVEAVGVVKEAVADRIGYGGVADEVMPFLGWNLARENRRSRSVAIVHNL